MIVLSCMKDYFDHYNCEFFILGED